MPMPDLKLIRVEQPPAATRGIGSSNRWKELWKTLPANGDWALVAEDIEPDDIRGIRSRSAAAKKNGVAFIIRERNAYARRITENSGDAPF